MVENGRGQAGERIRSCYGAPLKETRPRSERESLPWKREEIDEERSIARETKEIDGKYSLVEIDVWNCERLLCCIYRTS
jgi:hypothetical protein